MNNTAFISKEHVSNTNELLLGQSRGNLNKFSIEAKTAFDLSKEFKKTNDVESGFILGSEAGTGQIDAFKDPNAELSKGQVKITDKNFFETTQLLDSEGKVVETMIHKHYFNPKIGEKHNFEPSDTDLATFRDFAEKKGIRNHIIAYDNTTTGMVYYKRRYVHEDGSITQETMHIGSHVGDLLCVNTQGNRDIKGYSGTEAKVAQNFLETKGYDYSELTLHEDTRKKLIADAMVNFTAN